MKPEDFSKKRFKLIQGADYENGPISEHGTFGNMLKNKLRSSKEPVAFEKQGEIDPTYFEMDAITGPLMAFAGMFVPAKKLGKGVFSDIITRKPMKWIDDSKAELNSPGIFALREQAKYLPNDLQGLKGDGFKLKQDEYLRQYKDELSQLSVGDAKRAEELNNRIDWVSKPTYMRELMEEQGPTTYGEALKHDKLFEEMPELRDLPFSYEDTDEFKGAFFGDLGKKISLKRGKYGTADNAKVDTMLHEVQHSIQNSAGWPRGGNEQEFVATYNRKMDKLERVASAMRKKLGTMPAGPEQDAYVRRVWRAQDLYHQQPTPYEMYKSLYGEQMARAVQKQFNDPTSKNFLTGLVRTKTPWENLKIGEGTEVVNTKHFGEVGKLPDPLIRYRDNDPRVSR